jgi:mannose-6-phosphate isomerase
MISVPLYPLRFEPIYQYRVWGGRRFTELLTAPLPPDGPIGEAWILSDRADYPSRVASGPLQGRSLGDLLAEYPEQLLGRPARRFPLLLKFLDASKMLSVQVHPSDTQTQYLPAGEGGKTEAWVVLETTSTARICAGLNPGSTREVLQQAIAAGTVADRLSSFTPKVGDGAFIPAGTVHSLGGVVVFEVQQNSDTTFRLYDWDHIDAKTGRKRDLQVEQALACIDYGQGRIGPVTPVVEATTPVRRERLFDCKPFRLWRHRGEERFAVGAANAMRVLVCVEGKGTVPHAGTTYAIHKGDVLLLPAVVGACVCEPSEVMTLLEIAVPEAR